MDTEAFIRWALDDARTIEERLTVELLVERNAPMRSIDERLALARERRLNPAYDPHYSEAALRRAAASLAKATSWWAHSDRPIRDLSAFGFMTALEDLAISTNVDVLDVSPLTRLPKLRKLALGYPGSELYNHTCRDYSPLARCTALRDLTLGFGRHWPDFTGIEALDQLEHLSLGGNLLALPRGLTFPKVRRAALYCMPLAMRNVADLPHLPACEFLTLSGVEQLDGIERMPALRNLTLLGPFERFEPLRALTELTCLCIGPRSHLDPEKMPRDVAPLIHLPKLHRIEFGAGHIADLPRDYSPLTDAPSLRELVVKFCPPVEVEVAAINAALPPCDDLYLLAEPRQLPPLRMLIGPHERHPRRAQEHHSANEPGLIDTGLRECEARWVGAFIQRHITARIGHPDWGKASADALPRTPRVEIHSFESIAKYPLIIEATREAIARVREDYAHAYISIRLKVPPPEDSEAQKELLRKFRKEQDEWEDRQHERDRAEYLERLHQLELKKQEGAEITPEEFSPSEKAPYPEPPWEKESPGDDDDDTDDDDGDIATKEKPAPPSSWLDDDHPLACNYYLIAVLTLDEIWFPPGGRDLAIQLMRREPDEEFPEEKKP